MNTKRILSSITIGAGAIVIGIGLQIALADSSDGTFKSPTCTPPNCNTAAPINVGSNYQTKSGGFSLLGQNVASGSSTLSVTGNIFSNSILTQALGLTDANTSASKQNCTIGSTGCEDGYVLMNDGSGNAVWVSTSSLMGGGTTIVNNFTHHQFYTTAGTYTFDVPAGVTSIEIGAWGGGGGGGGHGGSGNPYGSGGNAGTTGSGTFTVTPGEALTVYVGDGGLAGGNGSSCTNSGGYGGSNSSVSGTGVNDLFGGGGAGGGCSTAATSGGSTGALYGFGGGNGGSPGNNGSAPGGGGGGSPGGSSAGGKGGSGGVIIVW